MLWRWSRAAVMSRVWAVEFDKLWRDKTLEGVLHLAPICIDLKTPPIPYKDSVLTHMYIYYSSLLSQTQIPSTMFGRQTFQKATRSLMTQQRRNFSHADLSVEEASSRFSSWKAISGMSMFIVVGMSVKVLKEEFHHWDHNLHHFEEPKHIPATNPGTQASKILPWAEYNCAMTDFQCKKKYWAEQGQPIEGGFIGFGAAIQSWAIPEKK